jgi:hypothetical protein
MIIFFFFWVLCDYGFFFVSVRVVFLYLLNEERIPLAYGIKVFLFVVSFWRL